MVKIDLRAFCVYNSRKAGHELKVIIGTLKDPFLLPLYSCKLRIHTWSSVVHKDGRFDLKRMF